MGHGDAPRSEHLLQSGRRASGPRVRPLRCAHGVDPTSHGRLVSIPPCSPPPLVSVSHTIFSSALDYEYFHIFWESVFLYTWFQGGVSEQILPRYGSEVCALRLRPSALHFWAGRPALNIRTLPDARGSRLPITGSWRLETITKCTVITKTNLSRRWIETFSCSNVFHYDSF